MNTAIPLDRGFVRWGRAYVFTVEWMVRRAARAQMDFHQIKAEYVRHRSESQVKFGMGLDLRLEIASVESAFAVREIMIQPGATSIASIDYDHIIAASALTLDQAGNIYRTYNPAVIKTFSTDLLALINKIVKHRNLPNDQSSIVVDDIFASLQAFCILTLSEIERTRWN